MKIVYTADLHGLEGLYAELLSFLVTRQASALILGGDLLPEEDDVEEKAIVQREFIRVYLKRWLEGLRDQFHDLKVFIMLGNDDWQVNLSYLEALEGRRIVSLIRLRPDDFFEPPRPAQAGCVVECGGAANSLPLPD